MPRDGIYSCKWSEAGICNFEGIQNGFAELSNKLDEHFYLDRPVTDENNVIEYYDRLTDTLMGIESQKDFETALLHSSQTYSPFSLVLKVNAERREEHWYNGEEVLSSSKQNSHQISFSKSWRVAKPKFPCIRSWLLSLERDGSVCKDISETCSYSNQYPKFIISIIFNLF